MLMKVEWWIPSAEKRKLEAFRNTANKYLRLYRPKEK